VSRVLRCSCLVATLLMFGCSSGSYPLQPGALSSSAGGAIGGDLLGVVEVGIVLCHATGRDRYQQISVAGPAEAVHRSHGDAAIGDPVPGNAGMVFDENCVPVPAAIRWTLRSVAFTDGGTATGYFDFDEGTGTILGWEISVVGGNVATFSAYTFRSGVADHGAGQGSGWDDGDGQYFQFWSRAADTSSDAAAVARGRYLRLDPEALLTSAGGDVPLTADTNLDGNVECFQCNPYRGVSSSSGAFVSGAAVP